jgi:hypothetical protein
MTKEFGRNIDVESDQIKPEDLKVKLSRTISILRMYDNIPQFDRNK